MSGEGSDMPYEIKPMEMAGLLCKLRERDICLISNKSIQLIFEDFIDFSKADGEALRNAMFFDRGAFIIRFRSAPGVVHELRIKAAGDVRRSLDGYDGDVVIHSAGETAARIFQMRYSAVWLRDYIKESGK
jgi:hypothetical protein